jgi:hypothetical protein
MATAANLDTAQSELDMAAANSLLGIAASPFGKNKGPANVRRFLLAQHLNLEIVDPPHPSWRPIYYIYI